MGHTILRMPEVQKKTGLGRSSIYLRISNGDFPKPIALGKRAVGWLESEIDDWLNRKISESRAPGRNAEGLA